MKLHSKRMDIYPITFIFSLDKEKIQKHGQFEIHHDAGGACYACENKVYMWLDSDDFKIIIPDMVHECFHAAMFTADTVGLRPTLENHESVAYLSGWFSSRVLDFINLESKK